MNVRWWNLPRNVFSLVACATIVVTTASFAQRMALVLSGGDDLREEPVRPVVVESAVITAEITGRFAVTTFDLTFRNPNDRVLEGTYEFPLLEGQTIVRFALDIEDHLREAVPIPKERGRVVFEQIERGNVDPGLLEQTTGNNYRARIYPIPAGGTRRVLIAYQEDLARDNRGAVYRLPLAFAEPLHRIQFEARVWASGTETVATQSTWPFALPAWQGGRRLAFVRENIAVTGVLELRVPASPQPAVLTQTRGDQEFFYAEVPLPADAQGAGRPRPKRIGLLWDASGSGRARDHGRELALLEAWFAAVRDVEVRLVPLRDHAGQISVFKVRRGNWAALRTALEEMVYDGASSWDGLVDDPDVDEWLLFSDGLFNFGATFGQSRLPLRAPVHAVLAATRANPAGLRALTEAQRGEFVNLATLAVDRAAERLRNFSRRVLAVESDAQAVEQVFPQPGAVVDAGAIAVTGVLKRESARIRLKIGRTMADARTIDVVVHARANPCGLVARAWAAAKLGALAADPRVDREVMRRTSQEFGLVTPDTSLIVLETVDDYLRYDVVPPEELRAEWDERQAERVEDGNDDVESRLDDVLEVWSEKVEWWKDPVAWTHAHKEPERPNPAQVMIGGGESNMVAQPPAQMMNDSVNPSLVPTAMEATGSFEGNFAAKGGTDEDTIVLSPFEVSDDGDAALRGGTIALRPWDPQEDYLVRLRAVAPGERYAAYLTERSAHEDQPGFFVDVADLFFAAGEQELALCVLSNLAELQLEDVAILRTLGRRLVQADRPDLALSLFERVLALRAEEPQSYRDLALVCAAVRKYQRAVDLLAEVVNHPWDWRFDGIEVIALGELNAIVATSGEKLNLDALDRRLRQNLPVGLRVVLSWDADDCDIDLWVVDPDGETADYSNRFTAMGGRMSDDLTEGYGPEEFLLRKPKPGTYRVRINYFADARQTVLGPVTVEARIITGFGTAAQKEQRLSVRLTEDDEELEIGTIEIK